LTKIKVFVCGPMTPMEGQHKVLGFLENVRRGMRASAELVKAGFAPFSPFTDFLYWFVLNEGEEITEEQIKGVSLAFVEVCDCVLVLEGAEKSKGAQAEIARAGELGKKLFGSIDALKRYYRLGMEEGR